MNNNEKEGSPRLKGIDAVAGIMIFRYDFISLLFFTFSCLFEFFYAMVLFQIRNVL